jgi:pyrimidine-specific ribonucleoside hydrolase
MLVALLAAVAIMAATPAAVGDTPKPVWIDTDPACGTGATRDVDDCWALAYLLRTPRVTIRGISSVFGNAPGEVTYATLRQVLERFALDPPPIVRGADDRDDATGRAQRTVVPRLAATLMRERLTILALGPLTNIKRLLRLRPDLAGRIERVVAVAGQRPGQRFFTGKHRLAHVHDMNFRMDPEAFRVVLHAGVPIDLVPFELARQVTVTADDLAKFASGKDTPAAWLAQVSRPWLAFWQRWLNDDGFFPFDSLAAGHVSEPSLLSCRPVHLRIVERHSLLTERATLEAMPSRGPAPVARYCARLAKGFKLAVTPRLRDTDENGER